MIVLWKKRKHGKDRLNNIYDMPDYTVNIVSQCKLQSEVQLSDNIAYGISDQQRSAHVELQLSDNIAYGYGASGQCHGNKEHLSEVSML